MSKWGQPNTWTRRRGSIQLTAIPLMGGEPFADFDFDATITDVLVTNWNIDPPDAPHERYSAFGDPRKLVADMCDEVNLISELNAEARAFIGKPYREWMAILPEIDMRYHT